MVSVSLWKVCAALHHPKVIWVNSERPNDVTTVVFGMCYSATQGIEASAIATWSPNAWRFLWYHVKGATPEAVGLFDVLQIAAQACRYWNSARAIFSFSGGRRGVFSLIGGPRVIIWCRTPCIFCVRIGDGLHICGNSLSNLLNCVVLSVIGSLRILLLLKTFGWCTLLNTCYLNPREVHGIFWNLLPEWVCRLRQR